MVCAQVSIYIFSKIFKIFMLNRMFSFKGHKFLLYIDYYITKEKIVDHEFVFQIINRQNKVIFACEN